MAQDSFSSNHQAGGLDSLSSPPVRRSAKPLGQSLIEAGLLSEPQLDLALRAQKRDGGFLGEVLRDTIRQTCGAEILSMIDELQEAARNLRNGQLGADEELKRLAHGRAISEGHER